MIDIINLLENDIRVFYFQKYEIRTKMSFYDREMRILSLGLSISLRINDGMIDMSFYENRDP